jgi:hypothetical protein
VSGKSDADTVVFEVAPPALAFTTNLTATKALLPDPL